MKKDKNIQNGFTLDETLDEKQKYKSTRRQANTGGEKRSVPAAKQAFTLAETLITLVIVGVVAALTVPTLIAKYQKEQTVTKLKKAYSTLSQAIIKSNSLNGSASNFFNANDNVDADMTKKFFNTYWKPYINIQKIADNGKTLYTTETPYTYLNGNSVGTAIGTSYSAGRVLFSDTSGVIYFLLIMDWKNEYDSDGNVTSQKAIYYSQQRIRVDINGTRKPNTYGKDVFYFVIDIDKNIVRPYGYNSSTASINSNCSKSSGGSSCAAKIMKDGWKISDDYPW